MREALDPFASVGTSNVFFQVVLGRTTPKEISESLENQQPPSVMEHLNKLRERGVVEREEKEGKSQPYEVNWKRFTGEFLDRVYTPKLQKAALKLEENADIRKELEQEQKLLKDVIDELRRNERFRMVLQGYFERLTKDIDSGLYPDRTIWGSIYCFEESLGSVISTVEKVKDPELRELLNLQGYFERLTKDIDSGLYPDRTIWESIYCFKESLGSVISTVEKVKDPELRELLDLLEKWDRCTQRFKGHGPKAAFERSIKAVEESEGSQKSRRD